MAADVLPTRRIVIMMPNLSGYLQNVQIGISEYFLQRPNWIWTSVIPRPEYANTLAMAQLHPDGVIAYVEEVYLGELQNLGVPVVDVSNWLAKMHFPSVLADDEEVGRLAARYFMDLGLRHFAVTGIRDAKFSDLRIKGYTEALAAQGLGATLIGWDDSSLPRDIVVPPGINPGLFHWLKALPKPLGVFATNDFTAAPMLDICRHAGIRVPEDVCVLGVDNDELFTKVTHPPLSSIDLPTRKIGFEAARLLDALMAGGAAPAEPVLLPPIRVETRQSTNLLAIPDQDVQTAVRYIRERVHTQVSVEDLLKVVSVNRRYLERKFRQYLGRSPLQEIRRVRLDKAKEMLSASDLSVAAIARRSGFPNAERLANVFHASVGITPTAYRRNFRLED